MLSHRIIWFSSQSFKMFTGTIDKMVGWKCKALSEESITTPATPGSELAPRLNYINNAKIQEKIDGSCLKQARLSYTRGSNKLFYCFWIRYMVMWFKHWFYIKILFIWSC